MAKSLATIKRKRLTLITGFLMLFVSSLHYWLYLKSPSITSSFEAQAFKLNFHSFKNSILHAHLYYQIKGAGKCLNDCYLRKSVGLDYNHFGFPVTTRFIKKESALKRSNLNDQDCALTWRFLMGSLHDSINRKDGKYLASWNKTENICIFKTTKMSNQSITYNVTDGDVKLIQLKAN